MTGNKHDFEGALNVCDRWLAHIEQQKQNTITLQKASSLARQGDTEGARRMRSSVDSAPRVFDGANFMDVMPQIQFALRLAARLQSGEVSHSVIKAMPESKARDDEGLFVSLGDHIDCSGENKTRTVIREAAKAMATQLMKEVKDDTQ